MLIGLTLLGGLARSPLLPSTGFGLQQNTNGLDSVNWSNVTATPGDNGTNKFIIVDPPTGNRFYRLKQ